MATIYDIAKASGVSATTVSHVLNRTRYVSPEVTSRVMDAVEELGYEPLRQRNKSNDMPLRYNNDKRKKPLFSRGSRVCRHLFNSFSKLKSDEKNIKKRRLFH